jgi:hypothetical protein
MAHIPLIWIDMRSFMAYMPLIWTDMSSFMAYIYKLAVRRADSESEKETRNQQKV